MNIGNTHSYSEMLSMMQAAMEAPGGPEDITATTNDMMKRASGSRADPGELNPPTTSDETRAADGGNLNEDSAMSDNVEGLDPEPGEGEATPDEGAGDDLGDDSMGGMDELGGEGDDASMGDDQSSEDDAAKPETPEQATQILKLQRNMSDFYNVLSNTMDTLGDYNAPATSSDLRNIFNAAVEHLSSAKDMLYELRADPITPGNYADKLRKYITLRHVYSTVLEILRLHFKVLDESQQNGSRK